MMQIKALDHRKRYEHKHKSRGVLHNMPFTMSSHTNTRQKNARPFLQLLPCYYHQQQRHRAILPPCPLNLDSLTP